MSGPYGIHLLRTKAILSPCRGTFGRRMYGASMVQICFIQGAEHSENIYFFLFSDKVVEKVEKI